ncbi:MAG: hypothetical protein E6J75_18480 [Deltaproteobacteria bacterium]|nr:MAG: hypothetical protein E6J75_18480 [Deltaproteobacteria bacterium]
MRLARSSEGPAWLVTIVALATTLRVAHVLALRATPWFDHLVVDPEYYDEWARRIAAGDWLGDRPFYMDPLYPYLLAVVYRLWGHDLLVVRLLQAALSAGSCALVAVIGRRVGGAAIGALAALGFALYEPEIFYVAEVDKTCLSIFLTAAALALMLGRSLAARFAAGAALGLAALTRANFLLFAPLGLAAVLCDRERPHPRGRPRPVAAATVFAAGLGLALLPVAWRNHHLSGAWILTTSQAGQNFYTGNNPTNPWGAYGALPFVRGNPHFEEADFRAAAEARAGRPLEPREVSAFWFAEAFRHIREHPGFAARAFFCKLVLFWNDFEISDNQDQYLLERDSWVLRLPLLGFGAVVPLALLGAVAGFRNRREIRLLCGFVVVYCASVVAFFIFSRYRIQVVPALLPLAAAGVAELIARLRGRSWKPVASAVAVLAGASLFCFHTFGIFGRDNELVVEMRLRHLAEMYETAGMADRAVDVLREAVAGCPTRCPQALEQLFAVYVRTGRLADGASYFRTFLADHPGHPDGERYLERLVEREAAAGGP